MINTKKFITIRFFGISPNVFARKYAAIEYRLFARSLTKTFRSDATKVILLKNFDYILKL
jgi:hypothetical protein